MPRPKRPGTAEERAARFDAAQAELTPEELQTQKEQNKQVSLRRITLNYIESLKAAKRWFLQFMEHQYPEVDAKAVYLHPSSPFPSIPLIKEYLRYLARFRVGLLRDELSTVTLLTYMSNLCSMFTRERGRLETLTDTRAELRNFILNDLVTQENVHTDAFDKHIVNSEDLTYLTSRLYERKFIATFPNMREFLNLNLFMCLMVDTSERGGALVKTQYSTDEMCLKWQDISFYSFQPEDDPEPTFDIAANVTIKWSKGQKLKESDWRTIPLAKLLPVSMTREDTLRLLLIVAILDGVIEGVKTWEDLGRIRAPPNEARTGRRIRMVEEKKGLPVLRYADRNHQLTNKPETQRGVTSRLRQLGYYAGLQTRLIGYCLRRGVANSLQAKVSEEDRKFMMGHKTTSTVYSAYHSRISMVDFVRLFRELPEAGEVARHSSMLLNRVDSAPPELSSEGLGHVYADPGLRELESTVQAIRTEILAKHPSIISASRANDPLWLDYRKMESERRSMFSKLRNEERQREYAAAFQDIGPQAVACPENEQGSDRSQGADEPIEPEDVPGETDEAEDWSKIDPRLWGEAEDLERDRCQEITENEADDDADAVSDGNFPPEPEDTTEPLDQQDPLGDDGNADHLSMRRHQLVEDHFGPNRVGVEGGMQRRRLLPAAAIGILHTSAYNDFAGELQEQTSEAGVACILLRYFSVMHSTHAWPSGFEPTLGTINCQFCGKNLRTSGDHPWRHIFSCSKTAADQRANDLFNNMRRDQSCGWKTMKRNGDISECEFGGTRTPPLTASQWALHLRNAHTRKVEPNTCFFGDCAFSNEDEVLVGTAFASTAEFKDHISKVHSKWAGSLTTSAQFCLYCNTWIIDAGEFDAHTAQHLPDALSNVSRFGYEGMGIRDRTVIPSVCPFHIHDETLPASKRAMAMKVETIGRHILNEHLLKQGKDVVCPSYPTMCTKADPMDANQMRQHLAIVHGIRSLAKAKDRTQEKAATNSRKRKKSNDDEQPLKEVSGNSKKQPSKMVTKKGI
jgi:hypothetical protein